MSLRRYQPQQKSQLKIQLRSLQSSYNGNINGGVSFQTRNSIAGNLEEYNTRYPHAVASLPSSITPVVPVAATSSTLTSVIPSGSATTSDAPAVTEQIANLLNLAQHLLSGVREQQQRQHRRRHRHRHGRESRLLAGAPYQRPNSEALHTSQEHIASNACGISGANVNTVSIREICAVTNDNADSTGQQQSRHTQFYNGGSNINNNVTSEDNINFQCAICLDSYLLHRPMVTQCGHLFCKRCIRQCVSCQGKCPMCNRNLNSKSMFRVYF